MEVLAEIFLVSDQQTSNLANASAHNSPPIVVDRIWKILLGSAASRIFFIFLIEIWQNAITDRSANYLHKQNLKEIRNYYTGFLRLNYDDNSKGDDDFVSSDENYTDEANKCCLVSRHDLQATAAWRNK